MHLKSIRVAKNVIFVANSWIATCFAIAVAIAMVQGCNVRIRWYLYNNLVYRLFAAKSLPRDLTILKESQATMPILVDCNLPDIAPFTINVALSCKVILQQHVSDLEIFTQNGGHEWSLGFRCILNFSLRT